MAVSKRLSDADIARVAAKIVEMNPSLKNGGPQQATERAAQVRTALSEESPRNYVEQQDHGRRVWENKLSDPNDPVAQWVAGGIGRQTPPSAGSVFESTSSVAAVEKSLAEVNAMPEWQRQEWRDASWRPGGRMFEQVVRPHTGR